MEGVLNSLIKCKRFEINVWITKKKQLKVTDVVCSCVTCTARRREPTRNFSRSPSKRSSQSVSATSFASLLSCSPFLIFAHRYFLPYLILSLELHTSNFCIFIWGSQVMNLFIRDNLYLKLSNCRPVHQTPASGYCNCFSAGCITTSSIFHHGASSPPLLDSLREFQLIRKITFFFIE